ncbi:chemotaxis protein CheW [Azospirillum rugosum]|uniref:Purine-binding chemotaxis protein CheW n=1 Tax=Azospirillum rugosum TaxID=416170 RepID=A0ABS4SIF8_9PROT|nr:chemotaxis protein CheW [Azospirillum rugosum]MBP2291727.1 purine-binding chemotaxis protein CheW [Azospirillum rugosum]MDQ0524461.1 purine-binding chemotaxis protein CheW [Azospirillum rugosum]
MVATASATRTVVFSVSGRVLALPADAVRRVLPLPRLDSPPAAPPVVAGLFRHRDRTVPVLRFDILLGFEPAPAALYAPLLLIEREGRPLALLVDRVFDIVPVPASALLEADAALSFNGCAVGAFPFGAGNATLLDPERLLTETEGRLLAAFQALADERAARWQATDSEDAAEPAP